MPKHSQQPDDQVQDHDLDQDRSEFGGDDFRAGSGMGQEEFGGAVLFFIRKGADTEQGCEKRAADAQDVATFNAVEAFQGTEIQGIQPEGGRERAHGGKDGTDTVHLALHFGIHKETDDDEGTDGKGPDEQRFPAALQFMADQGHACSPPFS